PIDYGLIETPQQQDESSRAQIPFFGRRQLRACEQSDQRPAERPSERGSSTDHRLVGGRGAMRDARPSDPGITISVSTVHRSPLSARVGARLRGTGPNSRALEGPEAPTEVVLLR